jgi:hypothetical protein
MNIPMFHHLRRGHGRSGSTYSIHLSGWGREGSRGRGSGGSSRDGGRGGKGCGGGGLVGFSGITMYLVEYRKNLPAIPALLLFGT